MENLAYKDIEQAWGKLKDKTLSKFDFVPLRDFCHIKKQPEVYKRLVIEVIEEMEEILELY